MGKYARVFRFGDDLLSLKFSRDDETDADVVGLDLAARAGFDPRVGVTSWRKMAEANRAKPLEFLSTHPAGENRVTQIERYLPEVMPF